MPYIIDNLESTASTTSDVHVQVSVRVIDLVLCKCLSSIFRPRPEKEKMYFQLRYFSEEKITLRDTFSIYNYIFRHNTLDTHFFVVQ